MHDSAGSVFLPDCPARLAIDIITSKRAVVSAPRHAPDIRPGVVGLDDPGYRTAGSQGCDATVAVASLSFGIS